MHVLTTIREITGQINADEEIRVEESPDSVLAPFPEFIAKGVETHIRGFDPAIQIGCMFDQSDDEVGLRDVGTNHAILGSFKSAKIDGKESLALKWLLDQIGIQIGYASIKDSGLISRFA